MPASSYLEKALLDWVLGGATPTQPPALWAGLAFGTPGSRSDQGSEIGTLTGYSRITAKFGAAQSGLAGGSIGSATASNTAAMTFGPFSSTGSILGVQLWDGSPVASSTMLWYGTFLTARTFVVGDSLVIGVGALTLTMS
jgi:hypothetical protein